MFLSHLFFPFSGAVLSSRPWETESTGSELMSRSVIVLGTRHRKLIPGILRGGVWQVPKTCQLVGPAWRTRIPAASVLCLWGLLWRAGGGEELSGGS